MKGDNHLKFHSSTFYLQCMVYFLGIGHSSAFVIIMAVCQTEEVDILKKRLDDICYPFVIMQAFKSQSGESTCTTGGLHTSTYPNTCRLWCFGFFNAPQLTL